MASLCRQRLGNQSAAEMHLDGLLESEERRFERGLPTLILPVNPPAIISDAQDSTDLDSNAPESNDGEKNSKTPVVDTDRNHPQFGSLRLDLIALERVLERFECSEAMDSWCMDRTLERRPAYQMLVVRLGGGLDEWMAEYDRRMELWGELEAHRDGLKQWRSDRAEGSAERDRIRLRVTLDWFESETTDDTKGEELASCLADRIYKENASTIPDKADIRDAIKLLYDEHRLPVDFAELLLLYVACRFADIERSSPGHARAFAKDGITLSVGAALWLSGPSGMEEQLAALAASGGLVNHIDVWLERHRVANKPFPTFDLFRKELIEIWEECGKPNPNS